MNINLAIRTIALLLLALLLAACDRKPPPPMAFGAAAWPGYEPLYLAGSLGYYSGVNLRLAEYGSAAEVEQAFRQHALQLAALSLDEALRLRRDVPDLKILLLLDVSNGADALLAQSGITSMQQLQGHRVGLEGMRAAYFLDLALQGADMRPGQIEIVSLPAGGQEAALRAHAVDAVVVQGPARARLQAAGAQTLFDSARLHGKLFDVLVARDDDIRVYHKEMMELMLGWQRALDYVRSEPGKATAAMAVHEKIAPAEFGAVLQGIELLGAGRNRELMLGDPPPVGAGIDGLQHFMLDRGQISMGEDVSALLDTSLLAGVRQ